MSLIPTGEKLLSYTEKILQLLEDATKAAMDTGTPSGTLKLGSSHTAAAVYVPNILADYHKTYPLVDLSLITGHSNDLVQQVLHFELDGAFVNSPVVHPDIVEEIVFHEVLVLATAKTESNKSCINHKPILMNSAGCQYRSQIEDWLHAEGIMTPRMMEFNTMDAIIGGVIANLGFSLIPKSNVQKLEEAGLVNTFPVPSPYCSVNTGFVRHKEALLTSTLVEFISLLGEHSKLIFPPN